MLRKMEIPASELKQSSLFLDYIKKNKSTELKNTLTSYCNIGLEEILEGLLLAANLQQWNCIKVLMDYAKGIKSEKNSIKHFKAGLGNVLMLAVRWGQLETVKCLFSYQSEVLLPEDSNYYHNSIFYYFSDPTYKKFDGVHRDSYNGYTVLDWAVKNNNSNMCQLLLERWNNKYLGRGRAYSSDIKDYIFLSRFSYRLAMSLDYIDCAKAIAKHHDWTYVRSNEDDLILFKTLLHNISFGVTQLKDGSFRFEARGPISIRWLNAEKRNAKWETDDKRSRFLNMALQESDPVKQLFFTQTINKNTPLGSLYAANNPYEGIEHKHVIERELAKLGAVRQNNQANNRVVPQIVVEPDEEESSNDSSDSIADIYSVHLHAYLRGFDNKETLAYQINELHLKPDEEALFEAFVDPITEEYIGIPVMLNEKYYDIKTLHTLKKDPFTSELFNPLEIQSARQLIRQFEDAVKKLIELRLKKPSLSASTSFRLFSPPSVNSSVANEGNDVDMQFLNS